MATKLEILETALRTVLGERIMGLKSVLDETTIVVSSANYLQVMQALRDDDALCFDELSDLCGMDYSTYGNASWNGRRFAVVVHLLSLAHNWRVRVRVFAEEDDFPQLSSITSVWPSANWFEREAFDFFGIVFDGHEDLRRILTDYGFIGHPFRKDFPISGYVEMRYDDAQKRVVYQPVTIEPRENTPRVIREENYGITHG